MRKMPHPDLCSDSWGGVSCPSGVVIVTEPRCSVRAHFSQLRTACSLEKVHFLGRSAPVQDGGGIRMTRSAAMEPSAPVKSALCQVGGILYSPRGSRSARVNFSQLGVVICK